MSLRGVVVAFILSQAVWGAGLHAQRLFVASGTRLVELYAGGARIGHLAGQVQLPGCAAAVTAPVSVLRGLYLAWWTTAGGACLFDVRRGTMREGAVPGGARIAAASDARFMVVFADRETVHVLSDPDGGLVSTALPPSPARVVTHVLLPTDTDRVLAVQADLGDWFVGAAPSIRILSIESGSGRIVGDVSVSLSLFANAVATDASGSRLYVSSSDNNGGVSGVFAVEVATGRIVAENRSVRGFARSDFRRIGSRSILFDAANSQVAVAAYDRPVRLDAATLAVVGDLDAPRTRIPVRPGFDSQTLNFGFFLDDSAGRYVVTEGEGQMWSYYPGPCLRTELSTAAAGSGQTIAVADLAAIHGGLFCGLLDDSDVFLITAPPAPGGFTATSSYPSGYPQLVGWTAVLSWAPSPGATHYTIEAGSAPGLADIARLDVGTTSFEARNLPPSLGVYVTVRAVGIGGQGPRTAPAPLNRP